MIENREKEEFMGKNILKENFPHNRAINSFKLKPFYLMTLEDNDGDTKQIKIYKNSDPYELAYNFCKENNLDFESMKYIKRNIKNIIKKFEEKDFYFLNNNNSIYEEEDEDNYEIGETYQNINGAGDSQGNGGTNENDSQNDKNMSNKIINSLIKNKGNKDQLKINKIPPKQTKINEQIKKVVKSNSLIPPNAIRNNLANINNNTDKNIKIKKDISTENNIFKIINNANTNKLNEVSMNTDYNSTTERNKQLDNLSKNNLQNSLESFENGVPLLKSLDNINIEKRKEKVEDGLNIDICIKNNEKVETIIRGSNDEEEKKLENNHDKTKEKEKDKTNIKSSNDLNLNKSNKNDNNIDNNLMNSNKSKNKMLNSKNSLNNINKKAITDTNNINYKLINLRKFKDKTSRMTRDLNNIKSYRNIEHNPQNTILFLTEYKNIINILKGFKKNAKNKTSSKEKNKKESNKNYNRNYIAKIIKKVVNQYRSNRSYDKYKKIPNQIQIQSQMKIPSKLKKNIHHHFSPQKKMNKFIEFNLSKKSSKENNNITNWHFLENNKSYKNISINHNQLNQLEKERVSSDLNYQNLSNTCRNNTKKIMENKSFNEARFYKKNKIKSKMLNKNMNNKAYNQKFKNNKNRLKKKNFTISNNKKIMEEKFIHYGSCNFRPLSKDFINGYLEGLKSKFSALIYSPLKEEKNMNNIIFNNQKSNIMFYEQKAQKNSMIKKCISNLKDNLVDNKTKTHIRKEIILYNNNNSRRNFKVNHSTLNAFNKTINYQSLHNSKEKLRNSSLNDCLNKSKVKSHDILSDLFKKIFFYLKNEKKKEMNISKNFYSEKLRIFPKEIRKILTKMINYLISNYSGKTIDKNNFINEMSNIYNTVLSKNEKNFISYNKSEIEQTLKQKKFQSSGRYKSIYHFDIGMISPLSLNNIKSITNTNKDKKIVKGIFNTISNECM